jgi:hypothetical protein
MTLPGRCESALAGQIRIRLYRLSSSSDVYALTSGGLPDRSGVVSGSSNEELSIWRPGEVVYMFGCDSARVSGRHLQQLEDPLTVAFSAISSAPCRADPPATSLQRSRLDDQTAPRG